MPVQRGTELDANIFRYIWRHTKRQQIVLLVLVVGSAPFLYYSYDLPKLIINRAIGGVDFPIEIFDVELEQVPYLMLLCLVFLSLVFVNGAFKYVINVFKGQLGERMLRRLRYELYSRVLRFPLPHFRKVSQGEIIPMITAEVEPLGGFIGDSFVQPVYQAGQLVVPVVFIMIQNPLLGLIAFAIILVQGYLIPKLQKRVNQLGKQRVQAVRRLSDRIGESIAGISEIHAHDTSNFHRADVADRLGTIYRIRYEIYRRKFFIKFLNNFLDKLTPFFFYSFGGYLVISGDMTIGALVAALNAYKDMAAPWKELLRWYQQKEDSRIKYEQVIEQFDPENMFEEELQAIESDRDAPLDGELAAANLGLADEDGLRLVDAVSFTLPVRSRIGVVGAPNSGKEQLGQLLARLAQPSNGSLRIGERNLADLPEAVTGRQVCHVGQNAYLFTGTLRDNLVYGLKNRPRRDADLGEDDARAREQRLREASEAGNIQLDIEADWIDYESAGAGDSRELEGRMIDALRIADMEADVYQMGLRGTLDTAARPDLAEKVLEARLELRGRSEIENLVEVFDKHRYNTNATVAENLLFGTPVGDQFDIEGLASNPYVLQVLDKAGLVDDFVETGRKVAETMVELFADLAPGHEFFEQFSFISSEDLPDYQAILSRAQRSGKDGLNDEDRTRLLTLPFMLIPARHRLGVIDREMQERILEARAIFAEDLPDDLRDAVEFFDVEHYNSSASLRGNLLFGRVAYGQARAEERVGELIAELLDERGMRNDVLTVGLEFAVGVGGSRLSGAQRQKVAVARCVLKQPDILIVNEALAALDGAVQSRISERLLERFAGHGVVWILNNVEMAAHFDHVLVMSSGRIVEQGTYQDLNKPGTTFGELLSNR